MADDVATLLSETGSQDAPSQDKDTGSQEDMPAWAKTLRDDNARLVNEVRSAQGQANRASRESAELRGQLSGLQASIQARSGAEKDTSEGLLEELMGLDQSDPAVKAVTATLKRVTAAYNQRVAKLEESLGQIDGDRQAQILTRQQQGIRDHNASELVKFAKRMKVEITPEISDQIRAMPTGEMWDKGCDLIEEIATKGTKSQKLEEVKKSGAFGEDRAAVGIGNINKARLRPSDLRSMTAEQVAKLDLSNEEVAAIMSRR